MLGLHRSVVASPCITHNLTTRLDFIRTYPLWGRNKSRVTNGALKSVANSDNAKRQEIGPFNLSRRQYGAIIGGLLLEPWWGGVQWAWASSDQDTVDAETVQEIITMANQEPDPEVAEELWGELIALDPLNPLGWYRRGSVRVILRMWEEAREDLMQTVVLQDTNIKPQALSTLAIAQGQCGDWEAALSTLQTASRLLGREGDETLDIPEQRGGANRLQQKIQLNTALARFQLGETKAAIVQTKLLLENDSAYWDARAALTAFYWAQGDVANAEGEWSTLCIPYGEMAMGSWVTRNGVPDQKGTPFDKITKDAVPQTTAQKIYINPLTKITAFLTEVEDFQLANECEDFETGAYLPCNDAGIPGLGGAKEPCTIYTKEEVELRLWPPAAVNALQAFRDNDPLVVAASTP